MVGFILVCTQRAAIGSTISGKQRNTRKLLRQEEESETGTAASGREGSTCLSMQTRSSRFAFFTSINNNNTATPTTVGAQS